MERIKMTLQVRGRRGWNLLHFKPQAFTSQTNHWRWSASHMVIKLIIGTNCLGFGLLSLYDSYMPHFLDGDGTSYIGIFRRKIYHFDHVSVESCNFCQVTSLQLPLLSFSKPLLMWWFGHFILSLCEFLCDLLTYSFVNNHAFRH